MSHPLSHGGSDFSVPASASLKGCMIETMESLFVIHAFEMGEYDLVEIPIRETGFSDLEGIGDGDGCVGKLIDHGLGRIQDVVLPADVF
jgi:hypothetical protein